jgi:hypothetical protein
MVLTTISCNNEGNMLHRPGTVNSIRKQLKLTGNCTRAMHKSQGFLNSKTVLLKGTRKSLVSLITNS